MNMKIQITILITMLLMFVGVSHAGEGWQMQVTASAGKAVNKMLIGQDAAAADGADALFDVPAFLSGDIQAYLSLEGEQYWQDIRTLCNSCVTSWELVVRSVTTGDITISWNVSVLPEGSTATLLDQTGGTAVDMRLQDTYSYPNTGERSFVIEVTR